MAEGTSGVISRYVMTIEALSEGWKIHLIGPDRRPVTLAGTELTWPLNAVVAHIKAQLEGPAAPNDSAQWEALHGGGASRSDKDDPLMDPPPPGFGVNRSDGA
jgi:hypothetical protein